MKFALGVLHWTPRAFWESTFYELSCAYIGFRDSNTPSKDELSDDDRDELLTTVEDLKERFPDGKISKADKRAKKT